MSDFIAEGVEVNHRPMAWLDDTSRCNCVVVWDFFREIHMWLHAPLANCDHPPTGTPHAKEAESAPDCGCGTHPPDPHCWGPQFATAYHDANGDTP